MPVHAVRTAWRITRLDISPLLGVPAHPGARLLRRWSLNHYTGVNG
ncbi:hypothetical protein ACYF6T_13675 [Streptomyces sp. 7R007]